MGGFLPQLERGCTIGKGPHFRGQNRPNFSPARKSNGNRPAFVQHDRAMRSGGGSTTAGLNGASAGLLLLIASCGAGCSTAAATTLPPRPIAAASPPKDDGSAAKAQDGEGGSSHAAALEQLKVAPMAARTDKQGSMTILLPDAEHWRRVRFLTVKSLVGFRYGKEHHAIVGALVTHVDDNAVSGACAKSFETWSAPMIDAFEVDLRHDAPAAFSWSPPAPPRTPRAISIVDIDALTAKTATVLSRDTYEVAWAGYPAWPKACLIVGVAIPARDEGARAKDVRDRFVRDILPKVTVTTTVEPKESY